LKLIHRLIATGGGAGYFPKMPGTFATLVGILLYYPIHSLAILSQITLICFFFGIGLISATHLEKEIGVKDPGQIVIDEIVGIWIALFLIPFDWQSLLLAFILFRFFDIRKPLGIRAIQSFRSGWGIMLDDALAGVYSNILFQFTFLVKALIPS
jgi:phosphatidylglycerophosphatase A